jgi:hypothetical protein
VIDENSKRTRVEPVFRWLRENGSTGWPDRLLELADGLQTREPVGGAHTVVFEDERRVPASARRLAWMIRNADRLAPRDGRIWREYTQRVIENPAKQQALDKLDHGDLRGIGRGLVLEGRTAADCLIECENAVIWIEGKRNDWLDYSTKWDVTRDQLARNAEAAWLYGLERGVGSYVVVCHEHRLKYHEELLIAGYRAGTWAGGWPHLNERERHNVGERIGTVTWATIASEWPPLKPLMI